MTRTQRQFSREIERDTPNRMSGIILIRSHHEKIRTWMNLPSRLVFTASLGNVLILNALTSWLCFQHQNYSSFYYEAQNQVLKVDFSPVQPLKLRMPVHWWTSRESTPSTASQVLRFAKKNRYSVDSFLYLCRMQKREPAFQSKTTLWYVLKWYPRSTTEAALLVVRLKKWLRTAIKNWDHIFSLPVQK